MSRCICRLIPFLLALAAAASLAAVSSAHSPTARVAGSCGVGSGRGDGYTYLTSLSVAHTSCANGKRLAKHHGHLSGWSCRRKVLDKNPVQYDARMSCKSGIKRVTYTFTQDT